MEPIDGQPLIRRVMDRLTTVTDELVVVANDAERVRVLNLPKDVTVTTRIEGAAGKAVADEKVSVPAGEFSGRPAAIDLSREISLTELAPGTYLFSVTASHGKTSVRRDVRFAIE